MVNKITSLSQDLFFNPDPWPKLPIAEYFFFLFIDEDAKANCVVVHSALRPELYVKGKSEVFNWQYPDRYVFKGVCVTEFKNNTFNAVGDVNIKFVKLGDWYEVKGDRVSTSAGYKREGNFDYMISLGNVQKSFKYKPSSLARIYDNGTKTICNFSGAGFMYQMFGNYKDLNSGGTGKCYIERVRLTTLDPRFLVWKLYDVMFDNGSVLSVSNTSVNENAYGVFIDRENNTYRVVNPNPEISIVGGHCNLSCYDGKKNKIEVIGAGCDPIYQTSFKRGPFTMNLGQAVGKIESFSINNEQLDKDGVVYYENTEVNYIGW